MASNAQIKDQIRRLRIIANRILRAAPEVAVDVAEFSEVLLDMELVVEDTVHWSGDALAKAEVTPKTRHWRSDQDRSYQVEIAFGEEKLCEVRSGADQRPFRCPRAVYDAVVTVIDGSVKPIGFDELTSQVNERTSESIAGYLIRVVLRFLRKSRILARTRRNFAPIDRASFTEAAGRAWIDTERVDLDRAP